MSKEDILDIVKPPQKDVDTVKDWLLAHGVTASQIADLGDAIEVKTNVKVASNLFRTFFHVYNSVDASKSRSIVRTYGTYSVDASVSSLIHIVTGISSFPIPHLRAQRGSPKDNQGIIAQSLQALYNIPAKVNLNSNTSQGVIEFEGQYFSPSDLVEYGSEVGIDLPVYPDSQIIGTNEASSPQIEASLDVDMITSLNTEASNWFWIEDGNGWLYQYATHFFSTDNVPEVVSISYGWSESDQCSINPTECSSIGVTSQEYVGRVNTEFQKIGLRGVSLLSASGDSGANGRTDDFCTGTVLYPDYPGSSPFITSVGATEIANPEYKLTNPPSICSSSSYQCVSGGSEQAVSYAISSFASGGGFSNVAARPSWQSSAVSSYLASGVALPPTSYFNQTSRGYPDIAAVGHNNLIYQSGVEAVGGTSASSPIWAGIVALLNQAAKAKDGKPLGFLNPLLYQIASEQPSAFHDITVGDNICTEYGCASTCQGFKATKGWDPVTGLGSPNFPALLKYIQDNL
jgi:tripeptidyl-peptidase-1